MGCVHRRLIIRSNPPGAVVYVDEQEIGQTPVATPFVYYGTRSIRLELDGYETVKEQHRIRAPWYQIPPLDFVSDNFTRRDLRDERVLDFQLVPMQVVATQDLVHRAVHLRNNSRLGIASPLPDAAQSAPMNVTPPAATDRGSLPQSSLPALAPVSGSPHVLRLPPTGQSNAAAPGGISLQPSRSPVQQSPYP